ncbi:unnamed protein product [Alopecurus aequalis]
MEWQRDQLINMTAALGAVAPLLSGPRRTVIQVEAFTSVVMALLLLQLILGSLRRQTSSAWVQGGTWVTYTLSFPAIAYTLGLMQSSPVKNAMYPIWALSLLLAAGCTNAVKVYELGENKQWKRSMFNYFQYTLYAIITCVLLSPTRVDFTGNLQEISASYKKVWARSTLLASIQSSGTITLLTLLISIIWVTTLYGRDGACLFVQFGHLDARRVSKFMNKPPADTEVFNPESMVGYRYPVHSTSIFVGLLRDLLPFKGSPHQGTVDQAITIDQIWQNSGSTDHGCKDVCLAYAMYQLLKRRYYGMACAEEHRRETRDFVLKGLLGGTHERAFRIVEVELGFCHDYFFTKHAVIFGMERIFFILFVGRISLIIVLAYFVWGNTLSVKVLTAIIEVQSRRADNIVTFFVLGTILLVELLQAAFYMASDWCKVSVACRYYSAGSRYQGNAFFEMLMGCINRFRLFGHWKNRIDQYSVLSKLTAADMTDEGVMQDVKLAVVNTLRSCEDGRPTNGEGSLKNNGVFAEFFWTFQGRSHAEIMLIWHIATEHLKETSSGEGLNRTSSGNERLNRTSSQNERLNKTKTHMKVSVCLSRYCAYLMHSAPELLPGYFGDTSFVMRSVKKDPRSQDGSQGQPEDPRSHDSQDRHEDVSILMTAAEKLGNQLKDMPDGVDPWKVLADFWTEKILYVAPSDNVKAHMERLANGGEFLTHIWALLTHAGHKINREEHNEPHQESA